MEVERDISSLPQRRKGQYLSNRQRIKIDTNLYKVDFKTDTTIGIYAAKTVPQVHYDNRKLRLSLLNGAMELLKDKIG